MKRKRVFVACVIALALACVSCVNGLAGSAAHTRGYAIVEADSPFILYHGRIDGRNPKAPAFDWAASGFSVVFTGSSIGAIISDSGENDFSVFIDGRLRGRLSAEKGKRAVTLAAGLPAGTHRLDFLKSTESDQGATSFAGLLLKPGSRLLAIEKPTFRIQVFGDSSCSGYGAAAPKPDGEWHRRHADACRTWAYFAARAFGAELTLTAASGRGILRNYGEKGPRSKVSFSQLAWRVLLDDDGLMASESESPPDLVILCLGHNDLSPGYSIGKEDFKRAYGEFLSEIRRRWPGVPLFCGSFRKEKLTDWLREIVDEESARGEKGCFWYAFPPLGKGDFGCDGHPNEKAHLRLAERIITLINEATGRSPMKKEIP